MNYIKEKVTENIGNSKELKEGQAEISLGKEGNISFDPKSNAETFQNFYGQPQKKPIFVKP